MTYVSNSSSHFIVETSETINSRCLMLLSLVSQWIWYRLILTRTWEILGEIIGESASDELIDQLFSQFCLGK